MRWPLLLAVLVLAAPGASACAQMSFLATELTVHGKEACDVTPGDCLPTPAGMTGHDATLRVWTVMDPPCFVEPDYPLSDIRITFSSVEANPMWLGIDVIPTTVVIPAQTFWHPSNARLVGDELVFETTRDVKVELWRQAPLGGDELTAVEARDGLELLFLKHHVDGNSDGLVGWRESFGVTEVRVDARAALPPEVHDVELQEEAPLGPGLVLAPLLAALLRRR